MLTSRIDIVEEAELAVLGLVLATSGNIIDELALTDADFYEPKRGELYVLMSGMYNSGKPVDAFTLADANPAEAAFIWSLTDTHATASSASYYADIVRKHALRRRLAAAGSAFTALDPTMDVGDLADHARQLVEAAIGTTGTRVRYVRDILPDVIARMEAKQVFVPSPWPTLNAAIGGFRPGAVYVIAARPGEGKTVVAGQIAAQLAEDGHVSFSSLEMTAEELVSRLISERLRINVGRIKDARMNALDWKTFAAGRSQLEALNIAVDDRSGIAASDVRTFARSVSRNGKLAAVVVDYMQLMVSKSKMDRHLQVAEFSRQLKIMAKDFQVPVIALSQLNRNSVATSLSVPKLSDLRESGAIEQDADVVILLRRSGDFDPSGLTSQSLIMDVAKNRHGETGEVDLRWDGMYSRAVEWAHIDEPTKEGNN